MRVDEIAKIQRLNEIFENKIFENNNKNYASQMNEALNSVKDYSTLNYQLENLYYSANKLQTTSEFISDNTQAKKYEFGSSANTTENQYIDKFQSSQLKNQISQFIETYNTTIEKVEKSNVKDASEYFDKTIISKNLENLGISKEEDGRLKFDETKFDKGIKPNQTEIKEITNTLQDIEKLAQSTNQAIVNTKTEISEEFKNVKNQITELQSIFTTEQNEYIKNSLNALFNANSLQSMLAGLGIARNLNEIV